LFSSLVNSCLVTCFFGQFLICYCDSAAIAVSKDHKPDQTDERQRIEEAGGFVMWAGTAITTLSLFFLGEVC
jgi:hypothetical protein